MSLPEWVPVREELRNEEPYGAPELTNVVRLNVNENPWAPDERLADDVAAAVREVVFGLNRYPDREATGLRSALADYLGHGLTSDQVWAANGSNEVMLHIMQAFGGPGRTAVSFAPTYSMYPEYARDTHTRWVTGQRRDDFTIDPDHVRDILRAHSPDVVLFTSPNNPTGTALDLELVSLALELTDGVVIVDEAYAEFRRATTPTALAMLADNPRLLVTRTMSKAFALAGARLGYVAGDRHLVDALRIVRLPYHLSAVTQAVAVTALQHRDTLLGKVDELRAERDELVDWLRGRGYEVADSDANFVLFGRFADRHSVWQGVLDRGVLIRETGPDGWLRVSVGTPAEMTAFRNALKEADPR